MFENKICDNQKKKTPYWKYFRKDAAPDDRGKSQRAYYSVKLRGIRD